MDEVFELNDASDGVFRRPCNLPPTAASDGLTPRAAAALIGAAAAAAADPPEVEPFVDDFGFFEEDRISPSLEMNFNSLELEVEEEEGRVGCGSGGGGGCRNPPFWAEEEDEEEEGEAIARSRG